MKIKYYYQKFWYGVLKRPYGLHVRIDKGSGEPVLLLHGIASSGSAWNYLSNRLKEDKHRVVAPDLLGFGKSPKPHQDWVKYTTKEHAREVINIIKKKHLKTPITIVGHSMGCLIAIEVAQTIPKSVKRLVLYEPPFYDGLPARNKYRIRQGFYHKFYNQIVKQKHTGVERFRFVQKLTARLIGFELTKQTWEPFRLSLKNTILKQTAIKDLTKLSVETKIIYGKLDSFVIGDKKNVFFDDVATHVTSSEISALHALSPLAGRTIEKIVNA